MDLAKKLQRRKMSTTFNKFMPSKNEISRAMDHWNSMTAQEKLQLLRPKVQNIRNHFQEIKDDSSMNSFSESLRVAEETESWMFWKCCLCETGEKFADEDSFLDHLKMQHIVPEIDHKWLQTVIPEIDPKKQDVWTPVDTVELANMLENQPDAHIDVRNFPLDNDSERAAILEKVYFLYRSLQKQKLLSLEKVEWLAEFTKRELHNIIMGPESMTRMSLALGIRFLGVSELNIALGYLQSISPENPVEKGSSVDDDDLGIAKKESELKDKFVLEGDTFVCTLEDEEDGESFVVWLIAGFPIKDKWSSWMRKRDDKQGEGRHIFELIKIAISLAQDTCVKQLEQKKRKKERWEIRGLCSKELEKREQLENYTPQSLESLLTTWQREHGESGDYSFESNVVSEILKEAQSANDQDKLCGGDDCIATIAKKEWTELYAEIIETEGDIVRRFAEIQELQLKLARVSVHDYRLIILGLLKLFMKDMLYKKAEEKSYAAREELLKEEKSDDVKNLSKGSNQAKHAHGKSKDKKKKKNYRKAKGSKAQMLHEDATEQDHSPNPTSQTGVSVSPDELKQQEEEHKVEIGTMEDMTRKLEEHLEYQRQIENEAKLKQQAEESRKGGVTTPENVEEASAPFILVKRRGHTTKRKGIALQAQLLQEDATEQDHSPDPTSQTGVSASPDELKQQEEEHKLEIKVEDMARKLEEHLEFQRQIEIEAKLKQQAEKSKKEGGTTPEKVEEELASFIPVKGTKRRVRSTKRIDTAQAEEKYLGVLSNDDTGKNVDESAKFYGTGLINSAGQNNCFLNVIIQSLWRIRRFRDDFLSKLEHVHTQVHCVVSALHEILKALNTAHADMQREALDPAPLRTALSKSYSETKLYQELQMNDASEVLEAILGCLHVSFSDVQSEDALCTSKACIAHTLFGIKIYERMHCTHCGTESVDKAYIAFVQMINTSELISLKIENVDSPFDKLLKQVVMGDLKTHNCGAKYNVQHTLSSRPHVFTTVLIWQSDEESIDNISATLAALATMIDIGVVYQGLGTGYMYQLVSVVCYCGRHFVCFIYNHDDTWVMFEDKIVKVIGRWGDVVTMCERRLLQPQVLFFEAIQLIFGSYVGKYSDHV